MTEDIFKHLAQYTRRYHAALEKQFEAIGRDLFSHHGEPTQIIAIVKASDGFATFYLPAPADPTLRRGYFLHDLSEYDLNRVCQSISVHRLQVAPPMLGEHWTQSPPMYAPVEAIPEFSAPWIHDEIRKAAVSGNLTSLPGMTVTPIVHIEAGVRKICCARQNQNLGTRLSHSRCWAAKALSLDARRFLVVLRETRPYS